MFDEDEMTLEERIKGVYLELGCPDIRTLARECLARGFWDDDRLDGAVISWASKQVKVACARLGANGLPFAMPIEKGAHPRWKQPDLFSIEEANFVIRERSEALRADHDALRRLHQFFVEKFGGGVQSIPDLW
jgi:hypothetical protein